MPSPRGCSFRRTSRRPEGAALHPFSLYMAGRVPSPYDQRQQPPPVCPTNFFTIPSSSGKMRLGIVPCSTAATASSRSNHFIDLRLLHGKVSASRSSQRQNTLLTWLSLNGLPWNSASKRNRRRPHSMQVGGGGGHTSSSRSSRRSSRRTPAAGMCPAGNIVAAG